MESCGDCSERKLNDATHLLVVDAVNDCDNRDNVDAN